MRSQRHLWLALAIWALAGCTQLGTPPGEVADLDASIRTDLDSALERAVAAREVPGAVLLVMDRGRIRYRRAAGLRTRDPDAPLTIDTVFDLASLTKVLCTAPAVLQLAARGQLDLDAPVARYWPDFGNNGKAAILVRQLLTHYSGLVSDLTLAPTWRDMAGARRLIEAMPPLAPPDTIFVYSDVNYAVLGELVRQASGETLDAYCTRHLFRPLRMRATAFGGAQAAGRQDLPIAPTSADPDRLGKVHDPTAARMGGIVGHAGLFGTADDLARYLRMLFDGGRARGRRVLRRDDIVEMTRNHAPPGALRQRGFGWDLAGDGNTNALVPFGSYGHTGFTGTSIWADPAREIGVILLTHRVYPDNSGQVAALRAAVAAVMKRW